MHPIIQATQPLPGSIFSGASRRSGGWGWEEVIRVIRSGSIRRSPNRISGP